MPKLVQFMHPGRQPGPGRDPKLKTWNTGEHRRCFLMAPGSYCTSISGSAGKADRILFWGEWEAPAHAIPLPAGGPAHAAFVPSQPEFPNTSGVQNTDPFVVDGPFMYSCCRQVRSSGTATYLRELSRGDVLLFGSRLAGDFVLDTVFVVAESELYSPHTGPEEFEDRAPASFVEATLKPLAFPEGRNTTETGSSLCGLIRCKPFSGCPPDPSVQVWFRLHWGATPEKRVNGMFSFAPAKVATRSLIAFERPKIKSLVAPGMTMGFRRCLPEGADASEVRRGWQAVTAAVLDAGLVLSTRLNVPTASEATSMLADN